MKNFSTSDPCPLSSLLFFAALVAHAATGRSARVNGFVSMGGDLGGTTAEPSAKTGGYSNTAATGGAPAAQTSMPASGGDTAAGGSISMASQAQAGTVATLGGHSPMSGTQTGGAAYTVGGASSAGGTNGFVISTSVGRVEATCTGEQVSPEQLAAVGQVFSQNSSCKGATKLGEPAMVSLLLLVDTTEAMSLPVQDTTAWRWDIVKQGILGFAEKHSASTLEIGIAFYGAFGQATNIANCSTDAYVSPAVSIDTLANNAASIASHFDALRTNLHSPATLYPALGGALLYASEWQSNHLDRRTAVVLVTDGRNQICDKVLADDRALVQSYAQRDLPTQIETFVVGVAGDPTSLDAIAEGGGTTRAYLVDGPGAGEQFTASLDNIVDTLRAWFVPEMSIGIGDTNDPAYVVVHGYTLEQGTYLVPRLSSAADCNETTGGWYLTTDTQGQPHATFCPCSRPNLSMAEIDAYYGCTLPFYPGD